MTTDEAAADAEDVAEARSPGSVATWADYSMMEHNRAGQLWSDGEAVSQFAWAPQGPGESHIYWGEPEPWPPQYHERFLRDGDWVMVDGWWGDDTYYTLRVTSESLCAANCTRCITIATSGPQHYAKWNTPTAGYCLRAQGVLTMESTGLTIQFEHTQIYSPPAPCKNNYYLVDSCIRQHEAWSDDNGTPFQKKLERTNYLAKNIGVGFAVEQSFPAPWNGELRYYWDY